MIKSAREAFYVIRKFFQQRFLGTFYMILFHLSTQLHLTLEIHCLELLL